MAFLFGYEVAFVIGLLHNELFVWYELVGIVDGFYECHSVFKATVFVSVSQYVFSICGMWLVSSDISGMQISYSQITYTNQRRASPSGPPYPATSLKSFYNT
jgi:hypothetical protein